ncbi:hypothetical protein ACFSVJ_21990 [Prauserella oleivorans]
MDLSGPDVWIGQPICPRGARPRWLHQDQLQQYAHRTAAYAEGQLSEEQFTANPGLEPVWVRFLHELQLVTLPDDTLSSIDQVL